MRLRENLDAYVLVGPWLLGFLLRTAGPMLGSVALAAACGPNAPPTGVPPTRPAEAPKPAAAAPPAGQKAVTLKVILTMIAGNTAPDAAYIHPQWLASTAGK